MRAYDQMALGLALVVLSEVVVRSRLGRLVPTRFVRALASSAWLPALVYGLEGLALIDHPLLEFLSKRVLLVSFMLTTLGVYEITGLLLRTPLNHLVRGALASMFYYWLYVLTGYALPELVDPVRLGIVTPLAVGATAYLATVLGLKRLTRLLGASPLKVGFYAMLAYSGYVVLDAMRVESPSLYALGLSIVASIASTLVIDHVHSRLNDLLGRAEAYVESFFEDGVQARLRTDEFFEGVLERLRLGGRGDGVKRSST